MTALPPVLEIFAPITKREKDPKTGHLYVYGKMTGPGLDHDRQKMSSEWLKSAVPGWFSQQANIREQHDSKRAIGKGVHLEEKDDGWYLGAKIVDKAAIEKVEEEVLVGFSIGVKNYRLDMSNKAEAPNGTVVSGRICETSLVDAPCLGDALIEDHYRLPLAKADAAGELQPVEDPALEYVGATQPSAETYGLLPELFDRLPSPAKQALADLAAAGATVTATVEKSETASEATPVVVNVTVQTEREPEALAPEPEPEPADPGLDEPESDDLDGVLEYADAPELLKDFTAAERRKMAASGIAMDDGSYPIPSKAFLRRAIRAVGRGSGDHNAVRAHIIKRAHALGLESMVPDNWNADGSIKDADAAKAIVADLETLGISTEPDLGKADADEDAGAAPAQDVADAKSAIAILGKLIVSEAKSLAVGNLNEACDISLLLQAVNALKWFINAENREPVDADGAEINLADEPDLAKGDGPKNGGTLAPPFKKKPKPEAKDDAADDSTDEDPDEQDDAHEDKKKMPAGKKTATKADGDTAETGQEPLLTKAEAAEAIKAAVAAALAADAAATETSPAETPETVTKAELADLVKAAVAEARSADQERIKALTEDLTKATGDIEAIKAMPIPGGPVLTRTAAQQGEATKSDAQRLLAEADALMAKADAFPANRDLAEGYRDRARVLRAKALA